MKEIKESQEGARHNQIMMLKRMRQEKGLPRK
jgi:hypothetical protein